MFKWSVLCLRQCREYRYPWRCLQTVREKCVRMPKLQTYPAGHRPVPKAASILVAFEQSELRHWSAFPHAVLSLGTSLVIVICYFPPTDLVKSGLNDPGNSSLQGRGWSSHGNSKGVEPKDNDGSHHQFPPPLCQEEIGDISAHIPTSKILSLHQHRLKARAFEDK